MTGADAGQRQCVIRLGPVRVLGAGWQAEKTGIVLSRILGQPGVGGLNNADSGQPHYDFALSGLNMDLPLHLYTDKIDRLVVVIFAHHFLRTFVVISICARESCSTCILLFCLHLAWPHVRACGCQFPP